MPKENRLLPQLCKSLTEQNAGSLRVHIAPASQTKGLPSQKLSVSFQCIYCLQPLMVYSFICKLQSFSFIGLGLLSGYIYQRNKTTNCAVRGLTVMRRCTQDYAQLMSSQSYLFVFVRVVSYMSGKAIFLRLRGVIQWSCSLW